MLTLMGAKAMLDVEKNLGEKAYIVYMNKKGETVYHHIDGRIEVVKDP